MPSKSILAALALVAVLAASAGHALALNSEFSASGPHGGISSRSIEVTDGVVSRSTTRSGPQGSSASRSTTCSGAGCSTAVIGPSGESLERQGPAFRPARVDRRSDRRDRRRGWR